MKLATQNRRSGSFDHGAALLPRYGLRVATLADSPTATTCSAIVARRHHYAIIASGSFEEAAAMVKAGVAQAFLCPGAYPKIGCFFMDPALRLVRSFAAEIPALVLAAKPKARPPFREVHAHPATRPFWAEVGTPVIEAISNDAAAAAVTGKRIACITNAAAAKHAGLKVLRVFREASPMAWNLFVRVATSLSAAIAQPCTPTNASPNPCAETSEEPVGFDAHA